MQSLMSKKGLSSVVSAVFFIACCIFSAYMISSVVFKETLALSPQYNCLEQSINDPISITSSCIDAQQGKLLVSLVRKVTDDSEITSLGFSIKSDIEQEYSCDPNTCNEFCRILEVGESKEYSFDLQQFRTEPKEIYLSVNGCSVEVATISACS